MAHESGIRKILKYITTPLCRPIGCDLQKDEPLFTDPAYYPGNVTYESILASVGKLSNVVSAIDNFIFDTQLAFDMPSICPKTAHGEVLPIDPNITHVLLAMSTFFSILLYYYFMYVFRSKPEN